LDNFLNAAQNLKIEGLMSNGDSTNDNFEDTNYCTEAGNSPKNSTGISEKNKKDTFKSRGNLKNEVAKINLQDPNYIEEVDKKIEELSDRIDGVWNCKVCGKTSNRKGNFGWHIETHLEGLSFPCNLCDKILCSRNSLDIHVRRFHK